MFVDNLLWFIKYNSKAVSAESKLCSDTSRPNLLTESFISLRQSQSFALLTNAPFLMTITIALLRERLRAECTGEWSRLIVSAHVVLHIGHLSKHFQANFALTALILATSFFI